MSWTPKQMSLCPHPGLVLLQPLPPWLPHLHPASPSALFLRLSALLPIFLLSPFTFNGLLVSISAVLILTPWQLPAPPHRDLYFQPSWIPFCGFPVQPQKLCLLPLRNKHSPSTHGTQRKEHWLYRDQPPDAQRSEKWQQHGEEISFSDFFGP